MVSVACIGLVWPAGSSKSMKVVPGLRKRSRPKAGAASARLALSAGRLSVAQRTRAVAPDWESSNNTVERPCSLMPVTTRRMLLSLMPAPLPRHRAVIGGGHRFAAREEKIEIARARRRAGLVRDCGEGLIHAGIGALRSRPRADRVAPAAQRRIAGPVEAVTIDVERPGISGDIGDRIPF